MNVFSVYLPSSEALGEDWWTEGVLKKTFYLLLDNSLHVYNTFRPYLLPSLFSLLLPALPPSPYQVPTLLSHLLLLFCGPLGLTRAWVGSCPLEHNSPVATSLTTVTSCPPVTLNPPIHHYLPWASLMRPSHREPNQGRLGE